MKLLEFLTYCELRDWISCKTEVNEAWDKDADAHWKVVIQNGGEYKAYIAYAVVGDVGVTVYNSIKHDGILKGNCELREIIEAFIPE